LEFDKSILFAGSTGLKLAVWFSRLSNSLLQKRSLRFRPLGCNIPAEFGAFSCDPEDKGDVFETEAILISRKAFLIG
jgi:hypothetical protein